jgi:hypothetical protein
VVTKLVFGFGMFSWRELFSGKVWLCAWATADGESGSPKLVFSKQLGHLGYNNGCENLFEKEPLHE